MKHLKVLVKWNWWWNFTCVLPDNFSELWNFLSRVPMRKCFWCYFRQLFISLAFRKCKKRCNVLKVMLVQSLCPLKTEIAQFPIGLESRRMWRTMSGNKTRVFIYFFFFFFFFCLLVSLVHLVFCINYWNLSHF